MDKKLIKSTSLFFYIFLIAVAAVAYIVVKPYLSTILLAVLTVLMFRRPYAWILSWTKNKKGMATTISILLVVLTFVIPLLFLFSVVTNQSLIFFRDLQEMLTLNSLNPQSSVQRINEALKMLPFSVTPITLDNNVIISSLRNILQPVGSFFFNNLATIGTTTITFITELVVFIMLLAGIFPNQQRLKEFFLDISPFDHETDLLYLRRIIAMSESMINGTIVVALVQGGLASIILSIAGVPYVYFWFMAYVFFSIVPLGGGLVVIPIGIIQLLMGNVWQGIFILIGQIVVVANIDNLIRPKLVSKEASMEPSLIIIGVLGGIAAFGFFGVIYGPVILIFLQTTIEIYMKYYRLHTDVPGQKREKDD
jgi:predicted PurR-regulated permease PerM